MSACPIPNNAEKVVYGPAGSLTAGNPDPSDESCNLDNVNTTTAPAGGTTTITQTQFCAGPPGPEGPVGPVAECGLGFKDEGEWSAGTDYYNQEENAEFGDQYECNASVVAHNGSTYYCVYGHTSDTDPDGDEPGVGLNWEFYWMPMALKGDGELGPRKLGLFDSLFNHILDIPNWGLGDWLLGIGAVAAGAIAVDKLTDMMEPDAGVGDGQSASQYNGTPAYSGNAVNATLPNVITQICQHMPFTVDVSQLADYELSFKRLNLIPRRNMLAQLSAAYAFSITSSGSTLRFTPYDHPSVNTGNPIMLKDMGFGISNSDTSRYKVERMQGVDLPRKVIIQYPDRELDYQDNMAEYEVQAFPEGQEMKIDVPFVMSYEEARGMAERALMLSHLEATKYYYTISFADWMELEPGDNIDTELGKQRILNIEITSSGGMEIEAVDASFVSEFSLPSGSGVGTLPTSTNTVRNVGYSTMLLMDMPLLNNEDTDGRVIAAVHGYGDPDWMGSGIYETFDNGGSYDLVATTRNESTVGLVATAIAAPYDYHVWDDDTVITVELRTGEDLLSVTDDVLYLGVKNICMIGSEVIAFGDVTLVTNSNIRGNRVYELTHLLRGLQGTEWAVDGHADNEPFILIDDTLVKLPYPLEDRNKPRNYKVVTIGSDTSKGIESSITPYGINLIPWACAHGTGEKLGATKDWLIRWENRTRFAPDELPDFVEPPEDFDWAGYTIQILDGSDNVMRTEHVTESNFTYTETMQIADFGAAQSCFKVKVFQNSSIVGGGYPYVFNCT